MKYAWIKQNTTPFETKAMCDVLGVSRSGYYSWENQEFPSARALENEKLSQEIKMIFLEHKGKTDLDK